MNCPTQDTRSSGKPVRQVRKRNGAIESFRIAKISHAIQCTANSVGRGDELLAEELAALVTLVLESEFAGEVPSTREVREVVERVLLECGHWDVARRFLVHGQRAARLPTRRPERRVSPELLVTSVSRECQEEWSRSRIVADLVLHAGVEGETASQVACSVETRVMSLGLGKLSASLIEDLVELELLERGVSPSASRVALPGRLLEQMTATSEPWLATRVGEQVLRRDSLRTRFQGTSGESHLRGELQIAGLESPGKTLALSLHCGEVRAKVRADGMVRAIVTLARDLLACTNGPVYLAHLEQCLAPVLADEEQAERIARTLMLALSESPRSAPPNHARLVLVMGSDTRREWQRRLFHERADLEEAGQRLRAFVRGLLQAGLELSRMQSVPRLRLLVPDGSFLPSELEDTVREAVGAGILDAGRIATAPRPARLVGARVGMNVARVALRHGRRQERDFLHGLKELTESATHAGSQRLRHLLTLDRAGRGPRYRFQKALARVRHELPFELPGAQSYQVAIIPVGLDSAIRAVTERDPRESESARQLQAEAVHVIERAMPADGEDARYQLSLESYEVAEGRFGRRDFSAYPRGRDILRLSHDGEAYRYGRGGARGALPHCLDPGIDSVVAEADLDELFGRPRDPAIAGSEAPSTSVRSPERTIAP